MTARRLVSSMEHKLQGWDRPYLSVPEGPGVRPAESDQLVWVGRNDGFGGDKRQVMRSILRHVDQCATA